MRFFLPLLSFTLLLCTCDRAPDSPPLPALGTAAAPVLYDQPADLAALWQQASDTVYVINFWATWCAPCREEMPLLQQLADEHADAPLRVILVSLDKPADVAKIPGFLTELAPRLPLAVLHTTEEDWATEFDRLWSGNLPTTLIYRKKLRYVYRRAFNTYVDLDAAVAPLLKQ